MVCECWTAAAIGSRERRCGATKPVILVVGDSLSAGYGVPSRCDLGRAAGASTDEPRVRLPSGECQHQRRHDRRCPRPPAARARAAPTCHRDSGARRQRRSAWPAAEAGARELRIHDRADPGDAGAKVVLVGMRMPPNYGPDYADRFHALYGELAKKYSAPLVDFFLDGVALDAEPDAGRRHPSDRGRAADTAGQCLAGQCSSRILERNERRACGGSGHAARDKALAQELSRRRAGEINPDEYSSLSS